MLRLRCLGLFASNLIALFSLFKVLSFLAFWVIFLFRGRMVSIIGNKSYFQDLPGDRLKILGSTCQFF